MAKKKAKKSDATSAQSSKLTHEEAVATLADYVRIDTTNPPGNEGPAAEFIASFLDRHSVEFEILHSLEGRPNLVARLSSGGDPTDALCLMHHMDVVPADRSKWLRDPFGGEIVAGELWGRGTLDMKGLGVMHLWAFLQVAEAVSSGSSRLGRDLLFVAVSDEEEGGRAGAEWLVAEHPEKVACSELLTEGGFGVASVLPGLDGFSCALTEKSAVWIKLEARAASGHGGIPPDEQAIENLLACIKKLTERGRRYRMVEEIRRLYIALSEHARGPEKLALRLATAPSGKAVLPLIASRLSAPQRALLRDLVTVTMLEAGYKPNVVPGSATATLDCRLLPDVDTESFVEEVRRVGEHFGVGVEVIFKCEPYGSSQPGDLFRALEDACKSRSPDALFFPSVSTGFTDSRFWRRTGTKCCGLTPSIISMDHIATIHGENERIPISEFERGIEITRTAVESLVLEPAG
jgi:acetylornithine deacetylase/succinyl-diaminopimelate desuccinylase-like protein